MASLGFWSLAEEDPAHLALVDPGEVVAGADVALVDPQRLLVGALRFRRAAPLEQAVAQRVPQLRRAGRIQRQRHLGQVDPRLHVAQREDEELRHLIEQHPIARLPGQGLLIV